MEARLRSLRLWNRALDNLERLNPPLVSSSSLDPFSSVAKPSAPMQEIKSSVKESEAPRNRSLPIDESTWRICRVIWSALLQIADWNFAKGSSREAEYFYQQAQDFAGSIHSPGLIGRALTHQGEIHLLQGRLSSAEEYFCKASQLLDNKLGFGVPNLHRCLGDLHAFKQEQEKALELYNRGIELWDYLQFQVHENFTDETP